MRASFLLLCALAACATSTPVEPRPRVAPVEASAPSAPFPTDIAAFAAVRAVLLEAGFERAAEVVPTIVEAPSIVVTGWSPNDLVAARQALHVAQMAHAIGHTLRPDADEAAVRALEAPVLARLVALQKVPARWPELHRRLVAQVSLPHVGPTADTRSLEDLLPIFEVAQ